MCSICAMHTVWITQILAPTSDSGVGLAAPSTADFSRLETFDRLER